MDSIESKLQASIDEYNASMEADEKTLQEKIPNFNSKILSFPNFL